MFRLWLVWRYLSGGGKFLTWTSMLAIAGMVIGVACMVVAMAVVSGVQSLLQDAIVDVTGHVLLMRSGGGIEDYEGLKKQIQEIVPDVVAMTPFVHVEAVLAHNQTLAGVYLQGIEPKTVNNVLKIGPRVIRGKFGVEEFEGLPSAMIGKEIARKFKLNPGDIFQVVVPRTSRERATAFSPRAQRFHVSAVLDLGKYDFNERTVVVRDLEAQKLMDIGSVYTGVRMKFPDAKVSRDRSFKLLNGLGQPYWSRDWKEVSQNFFSAVELEKAVIFVVLLFMIMVASFNISSTLFVSVLRRYSDISVLKTLGATQKFLVRMFVLQGVVIGLLGAVGGVVLGVFLSWLLSKAAWIYIPAEIYKFDHLPVDFRPLDLFLILVSSFVICFISTFAPARRGARLNPVEGLRYE